MTTTSDEAASFSPLENEAPLRWWRRLRLAGAGDLGAYRRALLFALVRWLPSWMWRITRLPLSFVPTHPDRVASLGFVKRLPAGFTLVTLALSAMMASRFAHEVVYHDALLTSFQLPVIAYVVLWSLALMLPLFAIAPALRATRNRAQPAYSALVGEQGRLVHRRWIEGQAVDNIPLLDAPEIGPVADAAVLYESVHNMQVVPIGKRTLGTILLPMTLPFLVLPLLKYPLATIMSALLKALL